jgi:hypothetical protein
MDNRENTLGQLATRRQGPAILAGLICSPL